MWNCEVQRLPTSKIHSTVRLPDFWGMVMIPNKWYPVALCGCPPLLPRHGTTMRHRTKYATT